MDNKKRISARSRLESGDPTPKPTDPNSATLDSATDGLLEVAVNMGYFDDMAAEALEEYKRGEVTDL